MKKALVVFFLILVFTISAKFTVAQSLPACTHYVTTSGNDSNNGTSQSTAFATLTKAISVLTAGKTLCIGAGTYKEALRISISGNSGSPITIRALDQANPPTISGNNYTLPTTAGQICWNSSVQCVKPAGEPNCYNRNYDGLINIRDTHDIAVRYINFTESAGTQITIIRSNNVIIANVNGNGSRASSLRVNDNSSNITIENSSFREWSNFYKGDRSASCLNWSVGMPISENSSNVIVRNNKMYEGWGEGMTAAQSSHHVQFLNNIVYDTFSAGIYVVRAHDVDIIGNHVYWTTNQNYLRSNSPARGIGVTNEAAAAADGHPASSNIRILNNFIAGRSDNLFFTTQNSTDFSTNILVAHNTLVNAFQGDNNGSGINIDDQPHTGQITNNIIIQNTIHGIHARLRGGNFTYSNNLWDTTQTNVDARARGSNDLYIPGFSLVGGTSASFTNDKYSNPTNFKIPSASSPAINIARALDGITTDFFGMPRIVGSAADVGAHEFSSTTSITPTTPVTLTPSVTSTPCVKKAIGDADCNNIIDLIDFEIWRKELTGSIQTKSADFDASGSVSIVDFEIWRKGFFL